MAFVLSAFNAAAQVGADSGDIVVTGIVRDWVDKAVMENVTVCIVGTSVGTVTNADGVFSLKIPGRLASPQLDFSHVGYMNTQYSVSSSTGVTIQMMPVNRVLDEAVVYGGDARRIVEDALERIPENYPSDAGLLTAFYRETIRRNSRYMSISEAVMDVYKTDYSDRDINFDRVRLSKARRLMSQKPSDTLGVRVLGGPNQAIYMDVVKNPLALFDEESIYCYDFIQDPSVFMDNRIQYVIRFHPVVELEYALYTGKLFIDCETLSITRAEYSLDLSDRDKAVAAVLRKKPAGLRFKVLGVDFLVSYRNYGKTAYLNYICNEIRFKCDWKRRLFSSTYNACSEMVVTEILEAPETGISGRESFKATQAFYDVVKEYWHEDFWKDYNIIEPTESLENAVRKLRK